MSTQLVAENQGLVHWQARRYTWSGIAYDDLVQEGNLGLLKAAERFDTSRGTKFSTYATWWIRQRISRAAHRAERNVALDETVGDSSTRRVDLIAGTVEEESTLPLVKREVICCLTPREERVLSRRFGVTVETLPESVATRPKGDGIRHPRRHELLMTIL